MDPGGSHQRHGHAARLHIAPVPIRITYQCWSELEEGADRVEVLGTERASQSLLSISKHLSSFLTDYSILCLFVGHAKVASNFRSRVLALI